MTTPVEPPIPIPVDLGPLLVTPTDAAYQLRIVQGGSVEVDTDFANKLAIASDAIRDYLKATNDPTWDASSAPKRVQQAVMLYLSNIWEHRGDDGAPADADAACWNAIARLLMRSRDPSMA
jgi:hypothetical protein